METDVTVKKTLVVDDHPMYMEGVKSILNKHKEIKVTAQATNAEEALELFKKEPFDFIITDISLPGMNGIEFIKTVKKIRPCIPTLVLSMRKGKELVDEVLSAEAEGYLIKKSGKKELFEAIDKIINGGTYYSSEITTLMMEIISAKKPKNPESAILTKREREILKLICKEYSNKEIAATLNLSISTIETHRSSMFQKTGAVCVVGLIKYAVENDLAMW